MMVAAVRLFHASGSAPKTALFLPRYLPTVIVVRRFLVPVHFNFGPLLGIRKQIWKIFAPLLSTVPDRRLTGKVVSSRRATCPVMRLMRVGGVF